VCKGARKGRGTIVLPGLVETHGKVNSLLSSSRGRAKVGYVPTSAGLGRHFLPSEKITLAPGLGQRRRGISALPHRTPINDVH